VKDQITPVWLSDDSEMPKTSVYNSACHYATKRLPEPKFREDASVGSLLMEDKTVSYCNIST